MSIGKIIVCLLLSGVGRIAPFTSFYDINHKLMVPDPSLGTYDRIRLIESNTYSKFIALRESRMAIPAAPETKSRQDELENNLINFRIKIREDKFCRFLIHYMYKGQFWNYRCLP